jgi:hypothetical protein
VSLEDFKQFRKILRKGDWFCKPTLSPIHCHNGSNMYSNHWVPKEDIEWRIVGGRD